MLRLCVAMRGAAKCFAAHRIRGACVYPGPNGCGKSTLIKTITRECYALARENSAMRIMGRERWDIFELRAHLGIVFAGPFIVLHHRFDGARRGTVGIFQQHQDLSASASGRRTCSACESRFERLQSAIWQTGRWYICPPVRPSAH